MTRQIIILLAIFLFASLQLAGKNTQNNNTREVPTSLEALIQAAKTGDKDAVLEIGRRGNKEAVAIIRQIKQRNSNKSFGSISSCAQMALAKLGEKEEFNEILAELRRDDAPSVQDKAIEKLEYIADDEAVSVLVELLKNSSPRILNGWVGPHGEKPMDKLLFLPINIVAMEALSTIIPNPIIARGKYATQNDITAWMAWWENNKSNYQRSIK